MKINFKLPANTKHIIQVAVKAFTGAAAGALGTYTVHRIVNTLETTQKKPAKKNPIGFDMRGEIKNEEKY